MLLLAVAWLIVHSPVVQAADASDIVDIRILLFTLAAASLVLAACIIPILMPWIAPGFDPLRGLLPAHDSPPPLLDAHASVAAQKQRLSSEVPHYAGLVNPSVDCYFNSVVQSLASLTHLARYLDDMAIMSRRWDVATPVTDALLALLVALNTPQARRTTLTPRALRTALQSASPSHGIRTLLSAQQQQDAHELCVLLMETLDAELGAVQQGRSHALRSQTTQGLGLLTAPSILVRGRLRTQLGFDGDHVSNPFRGTLAQRTSCAQCGYMEAVRHFSFTDLDLVVPSSTCTLQQCLASWMELEHIEWVCHRCSLQATLMRIESARDAITEPCSRKQSKQAALLDAQRTTLKRVLCSGAHDSELEATHELDGIELERILSTYATKQIMMARCPPILVLHLNRSSFSLGNFGASKNQARVVFPEYLDMLPFMTGATLSAHPLQPISPSEKAGNAIYRLSAMVTHYGTHNYGHYVSYRRRPCPFDDGPDVWTRVSDDHVQLCSWDEVQAQNPYLLMYERINNAAPSPLIPARTVHRWDVYTFRRAISAP